MRTRRPLIGFWITCARKNRNYLPSRSWCHPPEPRRARCLFSRGRARGSRTRFFIDQAAGTPTDWYRFLWATAWKRPQKICKWAHASEISAHPAAIERSIPAEQRDSGKEFFHYMPFVLLILLCLGRMPPFSVSIRRIDGWCRSNSLAMSCIDSPFCQRSHIKAFWLSV